MDPLILKKLNSSTKKTKQLGYNEMADIWSLGTICYEIEKWSLLKATLIHYCMTMAAFLITNALLGWFSRSIIIYVLLAMTIGFFMIWFAEYFDWKKTIKRMNQDLAGLR